MMVLCTQVNKMYVIAIDLPSMRNVLLYCTVTNVRVGIVPSYIPNINMVQHKCLSKSYGWEKETDSL